MDDDFVRIGDIISMCSDSLVVAGDGFGYYELLSIPKEKLLAPGSHFILRQALFCIEPTPSSKPISRNEREEELKVTLDQRLVFGERFQLRHLNSSSVINCSESPGSELGTLSLVLDKEEYNIPFMEITDITDVRKPGESIRYSDHFQISILIDDIRYYFQIGKESYISKDYFYLDASGIPRAWEIKRFSNYNEIFYSEDLIVTGNCLRIYHPDTKGFLSVKERSLKDLSQFKRNDKSILDIRAQLRQSMDSQQVGGAIIIENKSTCMSLWEIEGKLSFEGGKVTYDNGYRLKNVATGQFLIVEDQEHLGLSPDGDNPFTIFKFISKDNDTSEVLFETDLSFQSAENEMRVKVLDTTIFDEIFDVQPSYKINLESKIMESSAVTFQFVDEPEENSLYILKISGIIPKLVNFNVFLSKWEKDTITEANKNAAETDLKTQTTFISEILKNLNTHILGSEAILKKELAKRQNLVRKSGILSLLIMVLEQIDKMLTLPKDFPIDHFSKSLQKSTMKMLGALVAYDTSEFAHYPQVIAQPYLYILAMQIYETIYRSIRTNRKSCKTVIDSDRFFNMQF